MSMLCDFIMLKAPYILFVITWMVTAVFYPAVLVNVISVCLICGGMVYPYKIGLCQIYLWIIFKSVVYISHTMFRIIKTLPVRSRCNMDGYSCILPSCVSECHFCLFNLWWYQIVLYPNVCNGHKYLTMTVGCIVVPNPTQEYMMKSHNIHMKTL
jgi:hypothetical protein